MKNSNKKTKIVIASLIGVALVAVAGVLAYKHFNKTSNPTYPGPTAQEIKDAEDNKKNVEKRKQIEEDAKNNPLPAGTKVAVSPQIINASQNGTEIFISASIGGVFEDGGTCTAAITYGGQTVTRSSEGFADATTTSCTPIRIDRSEFSSNGTWSVVLTYSSAKAEGKSQAVQLVIQ